VSGFLSADRLDGRLLPVLLLAQYAGVESNEADPGGFAGETPVSSVELPVVGVAVERVTLHRSEMPYLELSATGLAGLDFAKARVILERDDQKCLLTQQSDLPPMGDSRLFAQLLGSIIREAVASTDGVLHIEFEDGWLLSAEPLTAAIIRYLGNWSDYGWCLVYGDYAWYSDLGRLTEENQEGLR
jgi:hypothetical protein